MQRGETHIQCLSRLVELYRKGVIPLRGRKHRTVKYAIPKSITHTTRRLERVGCCYSLFAQRGATLSLHRSCDHT